MDLSTLSLPELRRLQGRVETEIRRRSDTTRRSLLKQVQKMAAEQGMTLEDLLDQPEAAPSKPAAKPGRPKGSAAPKKPSVIKYRHPTEVGKGWSGHGRRPQWILDWQAQGKDIEELAV
ncbi:MAG: H-NS histone family protein [Thauera sp.]|jgi:DNA-binding protein H-NS|nr:H-NS histone family protein [Thauera sp.]